MKKSPDDFRSRPLVVLNTNYETRNAHITRAIVEDARKVLGVDLVHVATYRNVVDLCDQLERPVLLCLDGQRLNEIIIERAIESCSAAVLWTFDDPYNLADNRSYSSLFDMVCTNDAASADAYEGESIFLPLAAPSSLLDAPLRETADYDVFFCGTAWPNRVVLMNKMLREFPALKYKFALNYNRSVPPMPLSIPQSSYVHSLAFDDYVEFSRRSKITLALHRNFSGTDTIAVSSSPGPRVFEMGAAGAYQLSERGGAAFESVLSSNHLDYYEGWTEFASHIRRAVADEDYRQARATSLRDEVRASHTYVHRINSIYTELMARVDARSPRTTTRAPGRPKLLYVVHNTFGHGSFGGLEVHQDVLSQNLAGDFDIFFLATRPADNGKRYAVLLDSSYNVIERSSREFSLSHDNLESRELEEFFSLAVARLHVDLVHFFHFMHQAPSLAYVARSLGVPYVMSFHDFFVGCRRFNLVDWSGKFCGNDRSKAVDCDICLARTQGAPLGSQLDRRDYMQDVLAGAHSLIFMSKDTQSQIEGIYPEIRGMRKSRVHGAPIPSSATMLRRSLPALTSDQRDDSATRFVILGNFGQHKGSMYLLDAIRAFGDGNAEFHFHGEVSDSTKKLYQEVIGGRAHFHGGYSPGEVDVAQYDFSLHLSVWPETYCQTLSEAWAARVVPIVTDIGALGERVSHGVNGYKVDPRRPGSLAVLLREIVADPVKFKGVRSSFTEELFISQPRHAAMYRDAYELVLAVSKPQRVGSDEDAGNRIVRGVSLDVLERRRRTPLWGKRRRSENPQAETFGPDNAMLSMTSKLRRFAGDSISARGDLNWAKVGDHAYRGGDHVSLKNTTAVEVTGWVERPHEARVTASAFLTVGQETYVYPLEEHRRPDVAKHYSNPDAARWGMRGEVRLLVPDEMIVGTAELRLGWLLEGATQAWVAGKSVEVSGQYGG